MSNLEIRATKNSPSVTFNVEAKLFQVRGVSTMADAKAFYQPITDWILSHSQVLSSGIAFEFNLPYFNSGSNKCLYHLIEAIASLSPSDTPKRVVWCVEEDDEFMQEGGEALEELVGIQFEYKQVPFNSERLF